MRTALLILAVAASVTTVTANAEACSIRGRFCGYPSWAANAFEGPQGFKGNTAILTDEYTQDQRQGSKPVRNRRK